ncbi:hypothetical protein PVK06_005473 [Gossypium arboreum]|uniref:Uncharacterized protein n=1 Tax=Gossypium arboreum TaxID=29729 RepID=A0ABR0QUP9_GOSAR|nr:hypothetical protein PVK06_005473 [Gossypium arboreum]
MPSSHGTTISLERMVLLYSILTRKTIDVGKIILREMQNCAVRRFGPAYFPFTITILCLKAKILANQRVKESEDFKEEEDPTEIEPMQSADIPDRVEPMEPEAEPDVELQCSELNRLA